MASSLGRLYPLRKALHLLPGAEKKKLFEPGALSAQKALFARAAQEEDMKKKKKKKEKKKEKKKKGASDVVGEGEKDRLRFDDLVIKALAAPSPVRHVKEKERQREQEMEKYGLMTKARQIEVEQQKAREKAKEKAKKKKKPTAAEGEEEEEAEAVEEKPPLSKEEGMRLAKEYSRLLMREDRKLHAGETIRLRLKREAIAALPPELQEAARVPDMTPFPGLSPATLTPPIPGFTYEYERQVDKHTEDQQ